jgi:hypothetical protein
MGVEGAGLTVTLAYQSLTHAHDIHCAHLHATPPSASRLYCHPSQHCVPTPKHPHTVSMYADSQGSVTSQVLQGHTLVRA